MRNLHQFLITPLFFLVFFLGWVPSGFTNTIQVTEGSGADAGVGGLDGKCTLHEAIKNSQNKDQSFQDCAAGTGDDVIVLPPGTYNFNSSKYWEQVSGASAMGPITEKLTIQGSGNAIDTVVQRDPNASEKFRIFFVDSTGNLTLNNLTIQNGNYNKAGGAIYNKGSLTIDNCYLTNNTVEGNENGGAIYSQANHLTVLNSTFYANTSTEGQGGAVFTTAPGYPNSAVFTNSTFSENHAQKGGGIAIQDGIATLMNCTFWKNIASGQGGGIYWSGSLNTVYLINNILAENEPQNCSKSGNEYAGANNNLETGNSCNLNVQYNPLINQTDAGLGALEDNGGPTKTHALMQDSPAIDNGSQSFCDQVNVDKDQRGFTRPVGAVCDIGSVEFDPQKDILKVAKQEAGPSVPQVPSSGGENQVSATGGKSGGCSLAGESRDLGYLEWTFMGLGSLFLAFQNRKVLKAGRSNPDKP